MLKTSACSNNFQVNGRDDGFWQLEKQIHKDSPGLKNAAKYLPSPGAFTQTLRAHVGQQR